MQKVVLAIIILAGAAAIGFFAMQSTNLDAMSGAATSTTEMNAINAYIHSLPLREKIEGLLILHTPGTDPAHLAGYVAEYHPAGLILMEDNIPRTLSELRAETSAIEASTTYPYLIATDEEGCTVKRLASDTFPCAPELGHEPVASTTAAFRARSSLLASAGINLNFGIIADITSNPDSFIYPRVFGGNPDDVAPRVAAAVDGSRGYTLSTLKHFPGHGETTENSHVVVPSVSTTLSEWSVRDAVPFAAGVAAGADFVMFGQLTYSAVDTVPATLSQKWHDILGGLGFHGLSITDDMIMLQESGDPTYSDPVKNAVAALNAGNNLLLYVNDHGGGVSDIDIDKLVDGLVAAVQSGKIPESTIDAKLAHVLAYREETASFVPTH